MPIIHVQSFVSRVAKRSFSSLHLKKSNLEQINHLLPQCRPVDVTIVETEEDVCKWIEDHVPSKCHIGFDVEWKPSHRRGTMNTIRLYSLNFVKSILTGHENKISLLQYATDNAAMIYQTSKFATMPATLVHTLQSEDIVKVGVGVYYDLLKVQRDIGVPTNGFLDIGLALQRARGLRRHGLSYSFQHCFGCVSHAPLSHQQLPI